MDIKVKELETLNTKVMQQVDRSEEVEIMYSAYQTSNDLGLELRRETQNPTLTISPWSVEGIKKRIQHWQPEIENGGHLLAAWNKEKVVGFGIIGPKHTDGSIELCALFVSSEMRQAGVGTILFRQLEELAKKEGAKSLLIYSNPTESAVDFYRKQNCEIIGIADKRLVSHLPWDVVFAKPF